MWVTEIVVQRSIAIVGAARARENTHEHQVTGTMTDIGSTMGRISMIYLRRACRRSPLTAVEHAEIGVDARKLAVLAGLWMFYLIGGLIGIYTENLVPGPKALLLPASVTGSLGLFYMACRQLLKDYIKKLEQVSALVRPAACYRQNVIPRPPYVDVP